MDIATLVKPKTNLPLLSPGDTVKVSSKLVEGDKERTQAFQGVVLKVKQGGAGPIITVRRVTYGIGVERSFPLYSPRVEKVEVLRHGKARRARLFYLRTLSARAARIKERREVEEEQAAEAVMTAVEEVTPAVEEAKPAVEEVKPAVEEVQPPAQNAADVKEA